MIALRALLGPAIIVAAQVALFGSGYHMGSSMAEKRHQEMQIKQLKQYNDSVIAARQKEQVLQSQADQIKRESDAKISSLNTRVATLSTELRNRPARPASGVPKATNVDSAGCTGAGLYRGDSEFLIGIARDAQVTAEALKQCRAAYESLGK